MAKKRKAARRSARKPARSKRSKRGGSNPDATVTALAIVVVIIIAIAGYYLYQQNAKKTELFEVNPVALSIAPSLPSRS